MTSTRVITAVTLATLACLIAVAIALSTTPATPSIVQAHLEVGAGPPTTVTGILRYSDSSGVSITATIRANIEADSAEVTATAKVSIVTASVTLRSADEDVFLQVPGYASLFGAPWSEVRAPRDRHALALFASVLRHPPLSRLHARSSTTTRTDGDTTTTLQLGRVTVPPLQGLPLDLPRHGQLTLTVRTGTAGQVLAVAAHLWTRSDDVRASFLVTSYNQPVTVVTPPPAEVKLLDQERARAIFGINTSSLEKTLGMIGVRFAP